MFHFTIRDTILFSLAVATATAWYCDHCRLAHQNAQLKEALQWTRIEINPLAAFPPTMPTAEAKEMQKVVRELEKLKLDDAKVPEEPIIGYPPDWDALRKRRSK